MINQKIKCVNDAMALVKTFNDAERANGNIRGQQGGLYNYTSQFFDGVMANQMNVEQDNVVQAKTRVAEGAVDEYHHGLLVDYNNLLIAEARYLVNVKRALVYAYTNGQRQWS